MKKITPIVSHLKIQVQKEDCLDKEGDKVTASVWNQPSMTVCFSTDNVLRNKEINYENVNQKVLALLVHEAGHIYSDWSEEKLKDLQFMVELFYNKQRFPHISSSPVAYTYIQIDWLNANLKYLEEFKAKFYEDPVGNCLELGQILRARIIIIKCYEP